MNTNYLFHLLGWTLPVILAQWLIGRRILIRNLRGVLLPPLAVGAYFSCVDRVAIREGIWIFDPNQILGVRFGGVPIEEIIFFFVTSLLVSQSLILLLPASLRR
jgi:lycopene cyclase domain-containing protein